MYLFLLELPLFTIFFLVISLEYWTHVLHFYICHVYTKNVSMFRLFRRLNDIKYYKTLNLPPIPTWTKILWNLIWEKNDAWKTELPGNHKYQGLLKLQGGLKQNKHDLKTLKVQIPNTYITNINKDFSYAVKQNLYIYIYILKLIFWNIA